MRKSKRQPEAPSVPPADLARADATIRRLAQQLGTARELFIRLVEARAADRVRFNELDWATAGQYRANEIASFDAAMMAHEEQG